MLEVVISATALKAAIVLLSKIEAVEDPEVYTAYALTDDQVNEVFDLKTKLLRMLMEQTDLHIMSKPD